MINTERPAGVHKEADLHAQPVTGGTVVEGDLQIAFPRYRQWLLTLRDRSLGKNITKAYRMVWPPEPTRMRPAGLEMLNGNSRSMRCASCADKRAVSWWTIQTST
jgi:hypothetical protein